MQLIQAVLSLHAVERRGNRTIFTIQHHRGTVESETRCLCRGVASAVVGWEKAHAPVDR